MRSILEAAGFTPAPAAIRRRFLVPDGVSMAVNFPADGLPEVIFEVRDMAGLAQRHGCTPEEMAQRLQHLAETIRKGDNLMPKKIERIAGLNNRLDDIAGETGLTRDGEGRAFRLICNTGPNVRFRGWLAYSWTGAVNHEGRFLALRLYQVAYLGDANGTTFRRTAAASWLAEMAWCSENPGENDFSTVTEVKTVRDVMAGWDWSNSAKIAAKELRWDVTEYVGSAG